MTGPDTFDNFAAEYDAWFDTHEEAYALELEAVRQLLPEHGCGVEIGTGTGRFTQPLGVSAGVEPSAAMRSRALARGVNVIDARAESLPFEDRVYDYALLVTTVCFLDTPEAAFREVHRVLKPTGQIIIGLVDRDSVLGRQYQARKHTSRFYKEARFHSVEEVRRCLENTGFSQFDYVQAILPGDVTEPGKRGVKTGYGEGSFVVMRAHKSAD